MLSTHPDGTWRLVSTSDITPPTHVCQRCGQTEIRHVYTVRSPGGDTLDVGRICADRLCGGAVLAVEQHEREERKRGHGRVARRTRRHPDQPDFAPGYVAA